MQGEVRKNNNTGHLQGVQVSPSRGVTGSSYGYGNHVGSSQVPQSSYRSVGAPYEDPSESGFVWRPLRRPSEAIMMFEASRNKGIDYSYSERAVKDIGDVTAWLEGVDLVDNGDFMDEEVTILPPIQVEDPLATWSLSSTYEETSSFLVRVPFVHHPRLLGKRGECYPQGSVEAYAGVVRQVDAYALDEYLKSIEAQPLREGPWLYGDDFLYEDSRSLLMESYSSACCRLFSKIYRYWYAGMVSDSVILEWQRSQHYCPYCAALAISDILSRHYSQRHGEELQTRKRKRVEAKYRPGKKGRIEIAPGSHQVLMEIPLLPPEDVERWKLELLLSLKHFFFGDILTAFLPFLNHVSQTLNTVRLDVHEKHRTRSLPPIPVKGALFGLYVRKSNAMVRVSQLMSRSENVFLVCPDGEARISVGDASGRWVCHHSLPHIMKIAGESAVRITHSQYPPRPEGAAVYRIHIGCTYVCHRALMVIRVSVGSWTAAFNYLVETKNFQRKYEQDCCGEYVPRSDVSEYFFH